jgi:hypothetical protein
VGVWSAIAASTVALALTLAPRAAAACTCALPRPQLLATNPAGTFPAALPLLLASPPESLLEIQNDAGRLMPTHRVAQFPRLGLCETPWFFVAFDEDPVPPGEYHLVRGVNDAPAFVLTEGEFTAVAADLTVSLTVETHDPITPADSLCADPKIAGRPFSRTAHLSFALAARAEAVPMVVTATVADPETPGGLGHATLVRPIGPTGPDLVDLPLEDGAEACADLTALDGSGRIALVDRLCATDVAATHTLRTWAVVPVVQPTGLERDRGCAVAGGDRRAESALVISLALGIIVCAWRPRARETNTSTRTG